MVIVGNLISQSYMDEVLGILPCVSCARTSANPRPRMTTPEHISPESAIFFHQNNAVRIDWPVRSSAMSTIEHVKNIFG